MEIQKSWARPSSCCSVHNRSRALRSPYQDRQTAELQISLRASPGWQDLQSTFCPLRPHQHPNPRTSRSSKGLALWLKHVKLCKGCRIQPKTVIMKSESPKTKLGPPTRAGQHFMMSMFAQYPRKMPIRKATQMLRKVLDIRSISSNIKA